MQSVELIKNKVDYCLHLADTTLILSQRNAEWCGHGPILEQDIAITNISLDLLGQSRNFYQYAATLIGGDVTEDSLAYLRKEREFSLMAIGGKPFCGNTYTANFNIYCLKNYNSVAMNN
jgi:phenylacetate-CoA oxygenase PaaI subunit